MKSFHPNGFFVRLLHEFKNGARLRLHTWAGQQERSDPHDHRTWFISIPLWGRFDETRYREVPGDIPIYHCRSTTSKERLDIEQNGTSDVEGISTHVRWPLIPYYCPVDAIHTFRPRKNSFSATLVLFGPTRNKTPRAWIKEND